MSTDPTLNALLERGAALYAGGQSAGAAEVYRKALAIAPNDPTVRLRHALAIWHGENRSEEALQEISAVAEAYPQAPVLAAKGLVLNSLGRFDQGAAASRQAVTLDPLHTSAWLDLATAAKAEEAPKVSEEARALLARRDLSRKMRRDLHFARAACLRKMGEIDAAFTETECANGFETTRWDHDKDMAFQCTLRAVFTPALIEKFRGAGADDARMIFICGMPRSGTTLLERMLTAHPAIASAGETTLVGNLFGQYQSKVTKTPEALAAGLSGPLLEKIALALLRGIDKRVAEPATRVIDKMPANTLFIPFIRMILPKAVIVHVDRHPLDTCLSCLEASFVFGLDYATSQATLGAAYRQYADLMDHWRVLPETGVLDVGYEGLVQDPQPVLRRVLSVAGLDWDAACLTPTGEGIIKTASVAQARGALSTASVGRWRALAPRLQPLISSLGGMDWIESRPSAQGR